jgi:lycopene beta-cyclase
MPPRKILVLGAGCSGLAFAREAVQRLATGDELHILDSRRSFENDRTWCTWGVIPHAYEHLVKHKWSRCALRRDGREVVWSSRRYAYSMISSEDYYPEVLKEIEGRPNVHMHLGVKVSELHREGEGVRIESDSGPFSADVVYDARGWTPEDENPALLQHFRGYFVECEKDVFDPHTAVLMDFNIPQGKGLCFMYILPFTRRKALLEPTWMTEAGPFAEDVYRETAFSYLNTKYNVQKPVLLHEESGCLPMDVRTGVEAGGPCIPLGIRGGLLKPSSGYGFAAMMKDAEAKAATLVSGDGARIKPRSNVQNTLDKIFLSFMKRKPAEVPGVMLKLFEKTPADALARFLSDVPKAQDTAAVLWALRKSPMAAEAAHLLMSGIR